MASLYLTFTRLLRAAEPKAMPLTLCCAIVLFVFWACLLSPTECLAVNGWSEIFNLAPGINDVKDVAIDVRNGIVHIVYRTDAIHYLYSDDNGKHWSQPEIAIEESLGCSSPDILADGDLLHLVWSAPITVGSDVLYQLYYSRSEDSAKTWSEPRYLAQTTGHSLRPRLLSIPGGIAVVWFDLDQSRYTRKPPLDLSLIAQYLENPALNIIGVEEYDVARSSILMLRSFDNGNSFGSSPKMIQEVLGTISVFCAYKTLSNDIGIAWDEKNEVLFKESRDGGNNWDYNWKLRGTVKSQTMLEKVLGPGTEMSHILTSIEPYKPVPIRVRLGNGSPVEITKPVFLRSYPRACFSEEDLHIVWTQRSDKETRATYVRTDRHPPTSRIILPTDPDIKTRRFTIEWEGEDDISTRLLFAHSLDKVNWSSFEEELSGLTITTPKDGDYTLYLLARDMAGNIQKTPASFSFNTYSVAPDTFFLGTPPEICHARSISLSWSGHDNSSSPEDLLFSYRLDSDEPSKFLPQREVTFNNLTEGPHTVEVRAKDKSDNIASTPQTCTFDVVLNIQVDFTTQPETLMAVDSLTLHVDATDDSMDNPAFLFSYQLDEGPWSVYSPNSEFQVSGLSEGNHNLVVNARDELGNAAREPLEHEFTVDLTPPKPAILLQKLDSSTDHKPIIELQAKDNFSTEDEIQHQYRYADLDWSEWDYENVVTPDIPIRIWSKGYKVEARARDKAGNISRQTAVKSFLLMDRYPLWIIVLPFAIPVGIVFLVIVLIVRGRIAAMRRKRAQKTAEAPLGDGFSSPQPPPLPSSTGASTSTDENDLF